MEPDKRHEDDERVAHLCKEVEHAAGNRGTWEGHWEDVARFVFPDYQYSFYTNGFTTQGQKRGIELYDSTANTALYRFAALMESQLTPMGAKYQRWRPIDPVLMRNRNARLWYEDVTEKILYHRYSPYAGFQANQHETYLSIGAFGTGCIFTDNYQDPTQPKRRGFRYRHIPIGELFFKTNHQGQVDCVYRKFRITARQAVQKWGFDNLPDGLKEKLKHNHELEIEVWHIVKPNSDYNPERLDSKGRRFTSSYLLKEYRKVFDEPGYYTMPYAVSRYMTAPGENYGRGPAMHALAAIKTLQEEKRLLLQQGQLSLAPAYLAFDDGVIDTLNLRSGAVNFGGVTADGRPLVHALPTGNIAVGKDLIQDERITVNDAFLVTLFQILVETPQMTATEVLERAREKGALLSPTMGRYQTEGLGPMSEREFDLAVRQGLIDPPPQIVVDAGAEYMIEYDAPLNRAMKAEQAAGGMRTFQMAVEVAGQTGDMSLLDPFDTDKMLQEIGDINAMPVRWWRDDETIQAIRQNRAQTQQAQQVAQALPGMAAMMKAAAPEGTSMSGGQPA